MCFKKLRYLFPVLALLLCLPLAACNGANPLIGDWVLNTSQMEPAAVERIKSAAPNSRDNFMRLSFSGKYVLLGAYYEEPPKKKYLTPQDPEYYQDTSEKNKPPQGRKIPVTYKVHPSAPGKNPLVEVKLADMPKRDVTIYSYGNTEFIVWPVDGIEYRYERPKY